MLKTQQAILANYLKLVNDTTIQRTIVKSKIDTFTFSRILLFVIEIAIFVTFVSDINEQLTMITGILLVVPIVVFAIVVKKQNILIKEDNYLKQLLWVYNNEINVINGKTNGYENGSLFENEDHHYLSDLDIFGKSSLFEFINRCSTKDGISHLSAHLSSPNTRKDINLRQASVQELTGKIESTFHFRAILKANDVNNIDLIKDKLKNQLANQLKFVQHPFLKGYIKLLPFLMPILLFLAILIGGKLWGVMSLIFLIHAGVVFYNMKKINLVYYGFSGSANLLADYAAAIAWTENQQWETVYIQQLFAAQEKVSAQLNQLAKIIQAFDARLNLLVGAVLNFVLLWDLKCCVRLAEWHVASVSNVQEGLDRIGYFEELISISTLSYNQPNWTFPKIKDEFFFNGVAIGHPLIQEDKRITNSFNMLSKPCVDVITGSNMAGKSTFLRTLGMNMVLAYAGAPVCAVEMELSIFKILTYMRIKDSLNESTSTFKAELNRLKMILANVMEHPNALVLIDEMLRGTNSRDKYLGSKVFIEKLIAEKKPALFATHDLLLSELQEVHQATLRNFHFDIQIRDREMNFDYLIKKGPCKTFNAAILLKEIGLTLE